MIRLKAEKKFESPYKILITEIGKRSPIKIILPSSDNLDYKVLDAFLHRKIDLFRDHDAILKLTNAFPIVMKMIRNILAFEKSRFLPSDVSKIFLALIALKLRYMKMAKEVAVKRVKPHQDFQPAAAHIYPALPVHTMQNHFAADKHSKDEDETCKKDFNQTPSMTGGFVHMTCQHGITKVSYYTLNNANSAVFVLFNRG